MLVSFFLCCSKGETSSLSEISKSTVRQLNDKIEVKVYFTEELPPPFDTLRIYTRYLLEEYKSASPSGMFRYEFFNPTDENHLKAEAQKSGVVPANVQVRDNDKMITREAYLGLVFSYEGSTVSIPIVKESKGIEYAITNAICKVTSYDFPTVGFYGSAPDIPENPILKMFMTQQDKYQTTKQNIREHFDMVEVTLNESVSINVKTLVFAGVVDDLTTQQLYNLDQYLMNGNTAIIFQPMIAANIQTQSAQKIHSNIFNLLGHYGINMKDNIIMDAECATVNMQEQRGWNISTVPVRYPFIPVTSTVNTTNPVTANLSKLQYYFVSEIDTVNVPNDIKVTPLVYTSSQTSTATGPNYNINIQQFLNNDYINKLTQGRKAITALYEGKFTSFFDGAISGNIYLAETSNAKIILVPDMEFITSTAIGSNEANRDFLSNALDYLLSNPALIDLRNKDISDIDISKMNLSEKENTTDKNFFRSIGSFFSAWKKNKFPSIGRWKIIGQDTRGWVGFLFISEVNNNSFSGYIDWYYSPGTEFVGKEYYDGNFNHENRLVTLHGTHVTDPNKLGVGRYTATLSQNGLEMKSGKWGGSGMSGTWTGTKQE